MLLSTNQELRLHVPSNAFDDVSLLQGILDNSEKDFLRDKLGTPLYNRLCEYYKLNIDTNDFYLSVTNGTYAQHPWQELLLNAQRMIANDTLSRYAYQQLISANGAGMNMASSQDYSVASDKMLDKGVQGFKKEAMVSLNNLLLLLEGWAKLTHPMPISVPIDGDSVQNTDENVPKTNNSVQNTDENVPTTEQTPTDDPTAPTEEERMAEIEEIVKLWQQSEYYYLHHDLLLPTCAVLQQYIDIYNNRDKFIRLIPDLRFIQEEYIEDVFGAAFIAEMLQATDTDRLLKKSRRLMVAYLIERTSVLTFDKLTRQQAHDDAVSIRDSILKTLADRKAAEQPQPTTPTETPNATPPDSGKGFENNQPGTRIFVSPMLY